MFCLHHTVIKKMKQVYTSKHNAEHENRVILPVLIKHNKK